MLSPSNLLSLFEKEGGSSLSLQECKIPSPMTHVLSNPLSRSGLLSPSEILSLSAQLSAKNKEGECSLSFRDTKSPSRPASHRSSESWPPSDLLSFSNRSSLLS